MASSASTVETYLISLTILPQKYLLRMVTLTAETCNYINKHLEKVAKDVHVVHKFKVSGESRIVFVVDVSRIIALECLVSELGSIGFIDITTIPILHYETFARNIGAAEELVKLTAPKLGKDNLYWLELDIEYQGKTSEEFIDLWKREVEFVLKTRAQGESGLVPYKSLCQRKIHIFLNHPSVAQLDKLSFELPIMVGNGENIQIRAKRIQFLEEYSKNLITTCFI